ncbi:heme-degrading domain-containing protein [Microbacter sp. GSS18]|nr:heme-degrading domain-containing protein [Microbacter sp. GSS18]
MADETESTTPQDVDEEHLAYAAFDEEEAWQLGSLLRRWAVERGHGVAIDVRRPSGLILFRAALPGATADQEHWIRRKAAVVFRFERSSAGVVARLEGVDVAAAGWFDPREYALAGGSVPVRVRGAGVVAAVTVSGLSSEEDHALVVEALRERIGSSSRPA